MKLGVVLFVVGLAGTLLMLGAATDVGNWYLYGDPWTLITGVAFFIVFLFGYYRVRKILRKRNADRERRR